jgi:hypothetical protein
MTPEQSLDLMHFKDVVREMRAAQRDYFRHRTQEYLLRAKRLESEVDKLLIPQPTAGAQP